MSIFKILSLSLFLVANLSVIDAQSVVTYNFQKGEVLDILLITNKENSAPLFEHYKKTAFPVAMKLSYQPMPGFRISDYKQGNQHPQSFVLGKWNSLKQREQFLTDIIDEVPDFHEQRRAIWSQFALTYYEIQEDLEFQIDKEKYVVVTAYWQKEAETFQEFKQAFQKKSKGLGGKTIIELTNGKSPFGYYYQPDYLVVTQWESEADFQKFYNKNIKMDHQGVQHVNQFVLK